MKAMILAAGTGTRLRPLTDHIPKALIKIYNWPLLEHVIRYLIYYDVNEIIINVYHFPEQIKDFLVSKNNFGIRIEISDESEKLLDTGGGLKKASWFFNNDEPFFLMAVDIITTLNLTDMYKYHVESNALVTLAVKNRNSTRNLLFDKNHNLSGWKNNTTCEVKKVIGKNERFSLAFSGIHLISPDIFQHIDHTGRFNIIDLYLDLAEEFDIKGFRHDNDEWYEFGRIESIKNAENNLELKNIIEKFVKN